MAKLSNNLIMRNVRGIVGGQVIFKRRAGRMYVSAPPEIDENRVPTKNQQKAQGKFKRCTEYAKAAVKDPATRSAYLAVARAGQTAYNMALKDAYNEPEVVSLITQGYHGEAGDVIVVLAKDDFRVKMVTIAIYDAVGELIEEGTAVANADGLSWLYITTSANVNITGSRIIATATDVPGNKGMMEVRV